jgi:hypothetical protein
MPDETDSTPERKLPAAPKRAPRIVVDEMTEKAISTRGGTVIFRPNQVLDNDQLIRLAREHNVLTRER